MNSNDLTTDQARRMAEAVGRNMVYLGKIIRRMEEQKFPDHDPLYRLVKEAYDKVHHLRMDLHYRSCGHGVCRETKEL